MASDLSKRWIALYVPHVAELPHIVATPSGFFALSREIVGDGKVIRGTKSYLYRSDDGIRWQRTTLEPSDEQLNLRGIAYGNGHFVIVGQAGSSNVISTSSDGRDWSVLRVDIGQSYLTNVVYTGDHFFVLTTATIVLSSRDAEDWQPATLSTIQAMDVDYGNGVYVLVGSGPIEHSRDGVHWEARDLSCSLPGACITDPSGGVHQNIHYGIVFADRFYVDHFASTNGIDWQASPAPTAEVYVGGYLLGRNQPDGTVGQPIDDESRQTLLAWRPGTQPREVKVQHIDVGVGFGADIPAPHVIESPVLEGQTCLSRRCLVVGGQLYLVP